MGIETMAIASLAMSAIGTGVSAIGQANQAAASAGQMNYQAQIARNNQIIAGRNADLAREQGAVDADKQNLKTASIIGSQRAALASQGGDVNSGSPLDIVSDTERAGATDAATIRSNAALRAWGFENQGAGYGATASGYGAGASNTTAALPYGIGSSLLGGLSSGAGRFYDIWKNNPSPTNNTYGPEFDL